jgi:hypothetical protein
VLFPGPQRSADLSGPIFLVHRILLPVTRDACLLPLCGLDRAAGHGFHPAREFGQAVHFLL